MIVRTAMFATLLFICLGAAPAHAEDWKTGFVFLNYDPCDKLKGCEEFRALLHTFEPTKG